jgi:hypothetical protein
MTHDEILAICSLCAPLAIAAIVARWFVGALREAVRIVKDLLNDKE